MNKIEMHCKTKYSADKESTIDIESILWNAKENKEKGIVFIDKDSIIAFPKIEKIYKNLCDKDKSFKDFKIGYGVELTSIINNNEYEIIILLKNDKGLKEIYKIMSKYLNEYNKKIPINELTNIDNLLIGLIINEESIKLDLSKFDYFEINNSIDIPKIKNKEKIIYSNIPNALSKDESKAKEILYFHQKINKNSECRLYMDTEETLKHFNNKEIVVNNSNKIFENLENITINDDELYITNVDNYQEFENIVRKNFKTKFKNPSKITIDRLNIELNLIKNLNYTYIYILLMEITKFCKQENEYYQLNGYINNSLISYILDITEIEPKNLPYELFFSEIPKIELIISPNFYNKKMLKFIFSHYKKELIRCNYQFKLNEISIKRIIKHYEIKKKEKLNSYEQDYICSILEDIPIYKEGGSHLFYLIPKEKDIYDFTPYEIGTTYSNDKLRGTHYDYHDLKNNLISIRFILNEDIKSISKLINKTNCKVELCNDKRVYNLFRNTEEFKCKFNILGRSTGTLNIRYFEDIVTEDTLMNISNIWINDLERILMNINHGIIKDNLYNGLKARNLDDIDIFNVINYLKDSGKLLISKATILNKIAVAYTQMYYKLYYPKDYYEELLFNINYKYIEEKIYDYSFNEIKNLYYELNEKNKLDLNIREQESLSLIEILIEMYERNIKYTFINKKIIIKEDDDK